MADNNTILSIILKFLVDPKSQADANKAINNIGKSTGGAGSSAVTPSADFQKTWAAVNEYAKSFGVSVDEAQRSLAGMGTAGQKTEQQIRADYQAMERLGTATKQAGREASGLADNVKLLSLLGAGEGMMRLGGILNRFGQAALAGPITSYSKFAGQTTGASADYLDAQKELETSTLRVGAVFTKEIAPAMREVAKLANQVAGILEAHPELAKAAVAGLAGSMAVGGLLQGAGALVLGAGLISKVAKTLGASNVLSGAGAAFTGATGIAASAALPVAGAVVGEAAVMFSANRLGAKVGEALGLGTYEEQLDKLGQAATVGAFYIGGLIGKQNEWALAIGKLTGSIEDASSKTETLGPGAAEVSAFISFKQQEVAAERQYESQRTEIVKDFSKQRVDAEANYTKQRSELLRDYNRQGNSDSETRGRDTARQARAFAQSEAQAEVDYYRNRSQLAASYNKETQRAEEDHQRAMLEIQRKHETRMTDLADARDALGIFREMRDYEQQRTDSEQQYAVEASRRSQDFADRIAEMEDQFSQQRARRMADYQQQQADAAADYAFRQAQRKAQLDQQLKDLADAHKLEMDSLQKQEAAKLTDLQVNFNKERQQRVNAFNDTLRDLNAALLGERNTRNAYYQAMSADLQAWINNMQGKFTSNLPNYPGVPGQAAGGYTSGLVRTGEKGYEWILDHDTTRLAEKLAGGKLSQSGMISLMMGGGRGGSVTWNDHRRFDSKLSASDRRMTQQDTMTILAGALDG